MYPKNPLLFCLYYFLAGYGFASLAFDLLQLFGWL